MKASLVASLMGVLAAVAPVSANLPFGLNKPKLQRRDHPDAEAVKHGVFKQLLDHADPSKGTFGQRYWYSTEYWKGPGYPIFMLNGGEGDASEQLGYMLNDTLPGFYAQTFGGAVVLFEHRYFGKSFPFKVSTAETLQYLTVPQAIKDNTYFAQNVKLPFDTSGKSHPKKSPWVLMGGSYPGALTAWTARLDPGVFAYYHASSAVVEAVYDFWTYFNPIEDALPKNCSTDLKLVIKYVDGILSKGSTQEVRKLQAQFGLAGLTIPDFAAQLNNPLSNWQSNETQVFEFCDYIETAYSEDGKVDPKYEKTGVGLDKALGAYAHWIKEVYGPNCQNGGCDSTTPEALQSYNNATDLGADRSWYWMLCDAPFGWWQVGPPKSDGTNIVSSHLRPDYFQNICDHMFPKTNGFVCGSTEGFTVDDTNEWTGGWNATYKNVLFCDGEFDPWLSASVSSPHRPGGPAKSKPETPVFVIKNGNHVPDFYLSNSKENIDVLEKEITVMAKWLKDWKPKA